MDMRIIRKENFEFKQASKLRTQQMKRQFIPFHFKVVCSTLTLTSNHALWRSRKGHFKTYTKDRNTISIRLNRDKTDRLVWYILWLFCSSKGFVIFAGVLALNIIYPCAVPKLHIFTYCLFCKCIYFRS